jgi:hypothetical protein
MVSTECWHGLSTGNRSMLGRARSSALREAPFTGSIVQPETETHRDFIAAEMTARDLRRSNLDNVEAVFDPSASETLFREAVIAGLDRWLMETETHPRTLGDIEDYDRPLGE